MDSAEIIQFLKSHVALFKDFADAELDEMLQASRIDIFEPNESIIEFGREGRVLGVILEGEAEASVTDDSGDRHSLGVLRSGQIFGEMSLMTGNRSMADVICITRCKALLIPQSYFSTMLTTHPSTVAFLSQTIIQRVQSATQAVKDQELTSSAIKRSQDPYGFTLKTEKPIYLLTIDCRVDSLKYNLFDTGNASAGATGLIEKIGRNGANHRYRSPKGEIRNELPGADHQKAFDAMVEALTSPDIGIFGSTDEVIAVGHRVVHGGDRYGPAAPINDEVLAEIEKASSLAPLHNPVNLLGIKEAMRRFPRATHAAVFDTAFHQSMPAYAYLYGLPYEYFEQKQIRRYGFHGLSHAYASLKAAEFLKRPYNELETIVCHLGSGASVCAVDHGRSVDTSMGMTPAEGLIMGTRCGDIDPAVLLHLMRTEGLDADGLNRLINEESGLKGLSGVSNDIREIEAAANAGNARAQLAIKTYAYRVRKYIGAYAAAMGGLDAVVFTGGIGQGSVGVRSLACQGLAHMGIRIDERRNREAKGFERVCQISAEDSRVLVLVVPAGAARMVARETLRAIDRSYVADIIRSHEPVPVPLEVSAHHVHLSQDHVEALFGKGHELTVLYDLSQPGQYACEEKVNLIGPRGRVNNVRVLGPTRKETQVEIAMTEQFRLGVQPPIRESGNLDGSPGLTLEGTEGTVEIQKGVICAVRHIHMSPEDALQLGLKDKDIVRVRVEGERELIFGDVVVRVHPNFRLAMHIDTDEANAANITTGVVGYIDSIQNRR